MGCAPNPRTVEDNVAAPDFIAHDKADTVGVIVVETVKAGNRISGWIMENDKTIRVETLDDIPIGHKVALKDIKAGDTIIKYGHDIGKAVADIPKGGHVHVHNVKTKRW
ncbi:MAG: UxaA family hydrolase [Hyphomicrobiales bacterium]|nr:UxaA family hydrolase [Hyphomicrobiales bacterium]MCP5373677.1 UxaA family hydrolase [Hyphomicrobiales bacterium]